MKSEVFKDKKFERLYFRLIEKYNINLTLELKNAIKIILAEQDENNKKMLIEQIKEVFKLSDKQLEEYMQVVKMEILYITIVDDLNAIIELVSENSSLFGEMNEEILEIESLKNEFMDVLVQIDRVSKENKESEIEENANIHPELSSVSNFIILSEDVENDRISTLQSKSGKENMALLKILKEITILMNSNFESLRKSGKIHQINEPTKGGIIITEHNVAYERIGGSTSKVDYIRVPICKENKERLSKKYQNNNWRYLILIIGFGDFKNEGISEYKLYDNLRRKLLINIEEIERIIEIFSKPFTEESFKIATDMIEQGFSSIKSLSINPLNPLPISKQIKFNK